MDEWARAAVAQAIERSKRMAAAEWARLIAELTLQKKAPSTGPGA